MLGLAQHLQPLLKYRNLGSWGVLLAQSPIACRSVCSLYSCGQSTSYKTSQAEFLGFAGMLTHGKLATR
jgi:hypothetical protein